MPAERLQLRKVGSFFGSALQEGTWKGGNRRPPPFLKARPAKRVGLRWRRNDWNFHEGLEWAGSGHSLRCS